MNYILYHAMYTYIKYFIYDTIAQLCHNCINNNNNTTNK